MRNQIHVRALCHLELYRYILDVKVVSACLAEPSFKVRPLVRDLKTSCHVFEEPAFAISPFGDGDDRKVRSRVARLNGECVRALPRDVRLRTCRYHRRTRVHKGCNPHLTRGMRD